MAIPSRPLPTAETNYTYTGTTNRSVKWTPMILADALAAERSRHDETRKENVEEAKRALRRRRAGHK